MSEKLYHGINGSLNTISFVLVANTGNGFFYSFKYMQDKNNKKFT